MLPKLRVITNIGVIIIPKATPRPVAINEIPVAVVRSVSGNQFADNLVIVFNRNN